MFRDVQLSKELCDDFRRVHSAVLPFELDVSVCTSGSWPTASLPACRLPPELARTCDRFKDFYLQKHGGRRLEWRFDMGQADVKVRFAADNTKELTLSPYQMLIMLLLNHADVLTYKEIADSTGIAREALEQHLISLAHPKAKVLLKSPNTPKLDDADQFRLNDKFASKLYRTKIPLIKTSTAVKQEEKERDDEVEMQRKHQCVPFFECVCCLLAVPFADVLGSVGIWLLSLCCAGWMLRWCAS
jgi:hypothetical protein